MPPLISEPEHCFFRQDEMKSSSPLLPRFLVPSKCCFCVDVEVAAKAVGFLGCLLSLVAIAYFVFIIWVAAALISIAGKEVRNQSVKEKKFWPNFPSSYLNCQHFIAVLPLHYYAVLFSPHLFLIAGYRRLLPRRRGPPLLPLLRGCGSGGDRLHGSLLVLSGSEKLRGRPAIHAILRGRGRGGVCTSLR